VSTGTAAAPAMGSIVIYSWPKIRPDGRQEYSGAGLPDCPAIVLGAGWDGRVTLRCLGEHSTDCRGGVPYSPDARDHSWRWPDAGAAG
jgi:hypothetical protein